MQSTCCFSSSLAMTANVRLMLPLPTSMCVLYVPPLAHPVSMLSIALKPSLAMFALNIKLKIALACTLVTLLLVLAAVLFFGTRVSLLSHLNDSRRPRCLQYVRLTCSTIDPDLCSVLDARDSKLRLEAQRQGYSHPLVTQPAKRARL